MIDKVTAPYRRVFYLVLAIQCTTAITSTASERDEVRYVIDQRDGSPVAGAIVVVTWHGTFGAHSAQACNRLESFVSGADGSFRVPNDPKSGVVFVGAYKKGYERGKPMRAVQTASDGNPKHFQVAHLSWNDTNTRAEVTSIEPTVYLSRNSALEASREQTDVYLRVSQRGRMGRLQELHRLRAEGNCVGVTVTTSGAGSFYKAIHEEQVELNDSKVDLDLTIEYQKSADKRVSR